MLARLRGKSLEGSMVKKLIVLTRELICRHVHRRRDSPSTRTVSILLIVPLSLRFLFIPVLPEYKLIRWPSPLASRTVSVHVHRVVTLLSGRAHYVLRNSHDLIAIVQRAFQFRRTRR